MVEYGLNVLTDANCLAFYTWSINGSSLIFPLHSIIISAIPGAPKETNLPYRLKINFIWSAPDGWQIWIGSQDQVVITLQNYYSSRKQPPPRSYNITIWFMDIPFVFNFLGAHLLEKARPGFTGRAPPCPCFFAARSPLFWPHSRCFEYLWDRFKY